MTSRRRRAREKALSHFDAHAKREKAQDRLEAASLQLWPAEDRLALREALRTSARPRVTRS